METTNRKVKKFISCAILLGALGWAALSGVSMQSSHSGSAVLIAHAADCDNGGPPPDSDCPPTATPTATPTPPSR